VFCLFGAKRKPSDMMRPQLVAMAIVMVLAVIFGFGSGSVVEAPAVTEGPPPPPHNRRLNQTRSRMPNNFRVRYSDTKNGRRSKD